MNVAIPELNLRNLLFDLKSQRSFIRLFIAACDKLEWPTEPFDTNVVYQTVPTDGNLPPRHKGETPSKYIQALHSEVCVEDDTPALKYGRVRDMLKWVIGPENTSQNALSFAVVLILMLYKEVRLLVARHTEPSLANVFFYNLEQSVNETILGYVAPATKKAAERGSIKAVKAASTPAEYHLDAVRTHMHARTHAR